MRFAARLSLTDDRKLGIWHYRGDEVQRGNRLPIPLRYKTRKIESFQREQKKHFARLEHANWHRNTALPATQLGSLETYLNSPHLF